MKTRYIIMLFVIAIVTTVFLYVSAYMIDEQIRKIEGAGGRGGIEREIQSIQRRLNSAKVFSDSLREVTTVIENTMTNDRAFQISEANDFTRKLAELSKDIDIAAPGITPRVAYAQNNILEQQFTIEMDATYVQLGRFLTSIEAFDYIIRVNTLDVRPMADKFRDTGEDMQVLYKVVLELSIFKIVRGT